MARKKRKNPHKGQNFEREICRQLSLWCSHGKRDDYFWRSTNSGGRATIRKRQNKETHGQYGDIRCDHPKGRKLLKAAVFECKKGYPIENLANLVDAPFSRLSTTLYSQWVKQARRACRESGSVTWFIIHRRPKRDITVLMPMETAQDLNINRYDIYPTAELYMQVAYGGPPVHIFAMKWNRFLIEVDPKQVEKLK